MEREIPIYVICLIKSVITIVPLFYLSLFKVPDCVCKSIISLQRRFLWGWGKEKKSISWVSWEVLCKPKEEGGLGFRDIRKFNYALLAKWRWRLISEEKGRWKELLVSKYGVDLECRQAPIKVQSWWWRDLHKVCTEGEGEGWFNQQVVWKVGSGDKVRFWEDSWAGNISLKTLFPRLYSISLNQGQKVEEVGSWVDSVWEWKHRWRRVRFEWESMLESDLAMHLSRVRLSRDQEDIRVWGFDDLGLFSVNSAYECIAHPTRSSQNDVFSYLWKIKTFPNVLTTAWRVLIGRIPTRENLSSRGVIMNTILCAMCELKEETCQHTFIECDAAQRVWVLCFIWIGIVSVQQNAILSHFESFYLPQLSSRQNLFWKGVWATIVACIWEQRNFVVFSQGTIDVEEIVQKVQLKSWQWLKHRGPSFSYSFTDWMLNPLICIRSYKLMGKDGG